MMNIMRIMYEMCAIRSCEFLEVGPIVLTLSLRANAKRNSVLIMKFTASIRQ